MLSKSFSILGVVTLGCAIFGNTALLAQTSGSRTLNNSATNLQPPLTRNQAAMDAERVIVQQRLAQKSKASASHLVRGSSVNPGIAQADSTSQVIANGYRAYPPSCLSDPLPETPTAPAYSTRVDLAEIDPSTGGFVAETVTITLWRVACSSSQAATSGYNSATLMRIQRDAQYDGDSNQYPLFPGVRVAQNGVAFDDTSFRDFVRLPIEPNTVISTTYVNDPVVNSTTYVLEYLPSSISDTQNFNSAFNMRFDNFFAGGQVFLNGVPAYAPTQATYPAAFQPQPLSGYLSGNYYDPNHSGEGINIELSELANGTRALVFAWFTFDDLGLPYWITGSNGFNNGDTSVSVPTGYGSNGGFAGAFGAHAPQTLWGNVIFTFPDCNHITMQYASVAGLPAHTPSGSGTLNWQRLTTVNGLTCE